jgi:hypothetical protein
MLKARGLCGGKSFEEIAKITGIAKIAKIEKQNQWQQQKRNLISH